MANYSKLHADKLTVGTTDVSFLPGDINEGLVANGPVFFGVPPSGPLPLATVNMGPPAPPSLPSLGSLFKGLLTENKLGIMNKLGVFLKEGVQKMLGLKAHTGLEQQTGLRNQTGADSSTGFKLAMNQIDLSGNILANKKDKAAFDMPHPNKTGWRLRHICIEGPEIAVYCRGKVPPDGIINLPSFWDGFVNTQDMSINITPIGCWQELFVKEICQGKQVIVMNNAGSSINADYHIIARRLDDDLIVEYEGQSHEDYPGENKGYTFNFEYDHVKNLIQETVKKTVLESMQEDN